MYCPIRGSIHACLSFAKRIMAIHVDDLITGNAGAKYDDVVKFLLTKLPFRKWRIGEGEFSCSQLMHDEEFTIHVSQGKIANGMKMVVWDAAS